MTHHVVDPTAVHHDWDPARPPSTRIASGDMVELALAMAGAGQVREGDAHADTCFDFDTLYNLLGPIHVAGAEPGDTLRVDVVALETGPWGWTSILPGLGLLPEDFPEPWVGTWDLRGTHVDVAGIQVPKRPFLGTMGTHPAGTEALSAFPPHAGGGNVDTRHLTAGATLWLPVWQPGGMFSCGDPHAAQGDGEVCVSAVECDMQATLRLTVEKRTVAAPSFRTGGPLLGIDESLGHFGTMGLHGDLMEGARIAVRAAIDWLEAEQGLTRRDAYVLCSLAGDLKILEIVDAGVWNVGFTLPLALFAR